MKLLERLYWLWHSPEKMRCPRCRWRTRPAGESLCDRCYARSLTRHHAPKLSGEPKRVVVHTRQKITSVTLPPSSRFPTGVVVEFIYTGPPADDD